MRYLLTIFLTIIFLSSPVHAQAATFYVSSSGNDNNNGTSESTPWKTIDKVKSRTYSSGDQILFRAGDTWSGTSLKVPSSNITLGRYGSGNNPVINTTSPSAIIVDKKQNVTLDGLSTKSNGWVGIHLIDSSYITLKNFEVYSTLAEGDGVNFQASTAGATHHVTLEDFKIHGPMGWAVSGYGNDVMIRRGSMENIGKSGGEGKHGMYIHSWNNFTVEDVTILNPWNSCIKIIENVSNGTFRRVTCTGAGRSSSYGSAFMMGEGGGGRKSVITNMVFDNNTVSNTKDGAIVVDCSDKCVKNATVNGTFYSTLANIKTLPSPTTTPTPTPTPTNTPTPTPSPAPKPGDLNQDGTVNLQDFNLLVTKFGNPYTIFDFNQIVSNYGI